MTLSPELLAMIKDVPAVTDEEIERWATFSDQFVLRLISRIVAERKVVDDAMVTRYRAKFKEIWPGSCPDKQTTMELLTATLSSVEPQS